MALSTDEMLFNALFTQIVRCAPIGAVKACVREPIFRSERKRRRCGGMTPAM
jgi:hypothetical protein